MNQDIAEGKWKQLVGKAKELWGKLTDDELAKVNGNRTKLAGLLQEKYGKSTEQTEKDINDFFDRHR